MNTILFPTDFSKNAEVALHFALDFAVKTGSELVLLNVIPIPYDFATRIDEAITSLDDFSKNKLKSIINNLKQDPKFAQVSLTGKTMVGGLISSILEYSQENPVDLIIMGTKGASGVKKILFGTNTTEIIRRSNQPVLVVPENASLDKLNKIIFTLDYEEDGLAEIEGMLKIVKPLELEIQTVHVSTSSSLKEEIFHQGLWNLLETKYPHTFAKHDLIIHKSVFVGMEEYLDQNSNGLLVMTHHKKPFLSSIITKNKTTEMTYQTQMPLLILE